MGRYKLGPNGAYYDANDSGPDQASPDQIAALNPKPASSGNWNPSPGDTIVGQNAGISAPSGGVTGGSEGPGGITGKAQNPDFAALLNQSGQSGPWNGAGVPAGFDAAKWNNPTFNDPKYDIGHMVAGGWTNDSIANWVQQHPQEFQGLNLTGKDSFTDAQGNVFDFRKGMNEDPKGLGTAQWTQVGGPQGSAGAGGGAASGAAGRPMDNGGMMMPGAPGANGANGPSGFSAAGQGNVFSDPATTGWETLLRQLTDKLNTPQPNYTPQQLDLQQTQAIDPIERQRQQQKQQAQVQLAARGVAPGSGIYDSTMRNIDNQFNTLDAQTRGGFANQAIGHADTVFNNNENRMANAVNMMRQIPQLADQRLAAAQGSIQQNNPASLLALQNQIQNQGYNAQQQQQQQQQQFFQQLMQALAQAFQ